MKHTLPLLFCLNIVKTEKIRERGEQPDPKNFELGSTKFEQ